MMTTIFLVVVAIWAVFNTVERAAILKSLRRQEAHWQAQAQIVSCIADNAKDGAKFLAEHRKRIERLEQITALTHAAGPN
jgi:hypothetical protein